MNDRLREAFGQVQADEELKNRTREYVFQNMHGYARAKKGSYRRLLSAAACMVCLLFGGHWLYFTPTAAVSIDINPSMELDVNRFDRVISVKSYNDDGQELMNSLDLKYMDCVQAIGYILENDHIVDLLSRDEELMIGVFGEDEKQSNKLLLGIETCTKGTENTTCYYARREEVEKAHEMGLSYGKYRAFLELQTLDPDITVEQIQSMTMREIRDRIRLLSGGDGSGAEEEYGRRGAGKGRGRRN